MVLSLVSYGDVCGFMLFIAAQFIYSRQDSRQARHVETLEEAEFEEEEEAMPTSPTIASTLDPLQQGTHSLYWLRWPPSWLAG